MSRYSLEYLATHTVIGDVAVNGLPWTARCLGVGSDESVYTAHDGGAGQWLYPGAIPLTVARELFARFDVAAYPLSWVRPAMPWDDPARSFTMDGQTFTVCTDSTRQVIADGKDDRVHMVPKDGYTVHPFGETLVDRTARIVGDSSGSLHTDSVGVLADGGEGWVSIATGSLLTLPEGVDYYPHILASGSHTGTLATSIQAVITMTVCDNTRAAALGEGIRNGTVTKTKHTRMSAARLDKEENTARAALGLIESANETFAESVKLQCETPVTDSQWSAFVQALTPLATDATKNAVTRADKSRELWTTLYNTDARVSQWRGTMFGALQAVNTADLWERGTRGGTDAYARTVRDAITGALDTREGERLDALRKVLATV